MGDQSDHEHEDRSLDDLTDDELLDLISELPDDELAAAIRALIDRRRDRGPR